MEGARSGSELGGSLRFPNSPWSQGPYQPLGPAVPAFVAASYGVVDRPAITVYNLPEHAVAAEAYAEAAEKTTALITEWFGPSRRKAETADLADSNAAPFESGSLLLTPLTVADTK